MRLESMEAMAKELGAIWHEQVEQTLVAQLNDFISRGLIEVHYGPMHLAHDIASTKIKMVQSVELKLKDREYVEQLEKENAALKEWLRQKPEVST